MGFQLRWLAILLRFLWQNEKLQQHFFFWDLQSFYNIVELFDVLPNLYKLLNVYKYVSKKIIILILYYLPIV